MAVVVCGSGGLGRFAKRAALAVVCDTAVGWADERDRRVCVVCVAGCEEPAGAGDGVRRMGS